MPPYDHARLPNLSRIELSDLIEALQTAARLTEDDLPACDSCSVRCPHHGADLARALRWRDLAERLVEHDGTPDAFLARGVRLAAADRTEYAVKYRYPGDADWLDTRHSPLQTLENARAYRDWYTREVGQPSRLIERYVRETVIDA